MTDQLKDMAGKIAALSQRKLDEMAARDALALRFIEAGDPRSAMGALLNNAPVGAVTGTGRMELDVSPVFAEEKP